MKERIETKLAGVENVVPGVERSEVLKTVEALGLMSEITTQKFGGRDARPVSRHQ